MFIDTIHFQMQLDMLKMMFEFEDASFLPSCREGRIQLAKLERMIKAFRKKFPIELLQRTPKNKRGKMRSSDAHRLNRQIKVVERLLMKLVEEAADADIAYHGVKKAPKGEIRNAAQRWVHAIMSSVDKNPKALEDANTTLRALVYAPSKS